MIYTNKCRRKEDNNPFNSGLALDNEKLRKALVDSEAEVDRLKTEIEQMKNEKEESRKRQRDAVRRHSIQS